MNHAVHVLSSVLIYMYGRSDSILTPENLSSWAAVQNGRHKSVPMMRVHGCVCVCVHPFITHSHARDVSFRIKMLHTSKVMPADAQKVAGDFVHGAGSRVSFLRGIEIK